MKFQRVSIAVSLLLAAAGLASAQAVPPTAAPPAATFAVIGTPATPLPQSIYGVGVTLNPGAVPNIAGTGLVAKQLSSSLGTYAFGIMDALPTTYKPFVVNTGYGGGIAQRVLSIGTTNIFIPTAAGISYTGTNVGWQWSTGVLAAIPVKSGSNWLIMPNVRTVKSSVVGQYQVMFGIDIGYGK